MSTFIVNYKGEETMAKEKKLVEAITPMEEDFAQWYTDVVKKAELIDYSSICYMGTDTEAVR